MNVVVGRAYHHETPLFESEIRSVLFRPPWNVPLEIQRNELVPLAEVNPSYLAENSYDVVDAHGNRVEEPKLSEETLAGLRSGRLLLRQQPGKENSLGLIEFEFPRFHSGVSRKSQTARAIGSSTRTQPRLKLRRDLENSSCAGVPCR